MNFEELNIKKEIKKVIEKLGFTSPTPIQSEIIPFIMDGYDVLGRSETGTGKTLAFASGILSKIDLNSRAVKAIILAPTRELAIQVEEEVKKLGEYLNANTLCVYGSSSIENQIKALRGKVDIVVGTPGRVLDLIKRKVLVLDNISFFVLDEADEMLNMGFKEDIEAIFEKTNSEKQVLLFSATMPKLILGMAKKYMKKDYQEVSVISDVKTAKNIEQLYYTISDKTRVEAMCRIMDKYNPNKCIIFCKTKKNADDLLASLGSRGYNVDVIHGDIIQSGRIKTLERFKNANFNYLLATDVAARGIHVDDIDLIINYNLPQDNETYVHRIGRTGRAGNKGMAVTLATSREDRIIRSIENHIGMKLTRSELPTMEEIIPVRFDNIVKSLDNKTFDKKNEFISSYIDNLNDYDLKRICTVLLEEELLNNLGSDFKTDVSVGIGRSSSDRSTKGKNRVKNSEGTRVFLTIGKMDKVDKKTLLTQLEKMSGLPVGSMFSVEVMTKFTFMNIDNKYFDKFMKKCNKCKINGRTVTIEKAKN